MLCRGKGAGSILQPCRGAQGFSPSCSCSWCSVRAQRGIARAPCALCTSRACRANLGMWSSAGTACEHPAGLPAASHSSGSLGGQLGAPGGSALPRQQLQVPQGLQKSPTRAFLPQELHTSAQLQSRLSTVRGPAQSCAGLFPKPRGVSGAIEQLWSPSPQGRGLALHSLTGHTTAKEKVQEWIISALLVQLWGPLLPKSWLGDCCWESHKAF